MKLSDWFRPPRVVLTLFISLMTVCAVALGWLGLQVFVQDRAMETQRHQEPLESAADRAVAAIERGFAASDVEVRVSASGQVEISPAGRLAYAPAQPVSVVQPDMFSKAEAMEFGGQDQAKGRRHVHPAG